MSSSIRQRRVGSPPPASPTVGLGNGMTRRSQTQQAGNLNSGLTESDTPLSQEHTPAVEDQQLSEEDLRLKQIEEAKEILKQRWRNWHVRSFWSLVMIGSFWLILLMGHAWVVALVTVIHTLVYREVISIAWVPSKVKRMPWFRTMTWYFLLSTNYYLYGQTVIQYFKQNGFVDSPLATHHSFVSFILYVLGFVFFVFNLQKDHYKFQFSQFAWTHMTLLLVVVQSQFIVKNIFEGLVWFLVPVSLVICNDITAYVAGFFFGKTPLIQLSPKKTWEGFLGGFVATVVFGFVFGGWIIREKYMICPVSNLRTSYWSNLDCEPNPVFRFVDVAVPQQVTSLVFTVTAGMVQFVKFKVAPFQLHAVIMALFASIIAPFGGFFASGAKRAFKIKDFGDYIPGHGGITDRMDCQFLMSFFAFLYYQSFIAARGLTVPEAMDLIVTGLNSSDQMELLRQLQSYISSYQQQQGVGAAVPIGV